MRKLGLIANISSFIFIIDGYSLNYFFVEGVCMTIPEGAVKKGHEAELYLGVWRDDTNRPKMSGAYLSEQERKNSKTGGILRMFPCIVNFGCYL